MMDPASATADHVQGTKLLGTYMYELAKAE
jgi:hypothetical protein